MAAQLGYVLWAIDRFAYLSRTTASATARVISVRRTPQTAQIVPGASTSAATAYSSPAGSPALAPRLAASYKIAMAITMGYMLITML